jgi:transcriptional regulator of acetoin/glycerol metabolism
MLGLIVTAVSDAARRIEAANFRQVYSRDRITLSPDGDAAALLAIDRNDFVVGASRAARRLHAITEERLAAGLPASAIFSADGDGEDLRSAERAALQRALARAAGNVSAAARTLGLSRATMHRKLARLGLVRRD